MDIGSAAIALGGLVVGGGGVLVSYLQPARDRKGRQAEKLFDQRWAVCLGLVTDGVNGMAYLNRNILQLEAGATRLEPVSSDHDYLHHLAMAKLVGGDIEDAWEVFVDAWNAFLQDLDKAKTRVTQLVVLRQHQPMVREALNGLVAKADALLRNK